MKSTYLIYPAALFIASCSSTHKKPEMSEYFVTHITEDGTKQFSYSLIASNPRSENKGRNNSGGGRGGKGGGRTGGGPPNNNNDSSKKFEMQERFLKKLDQILFETDYCQEGFIKLDSTFERGLSQFRGKCEEQASNEDKEQFPNQ